MGRFSTILFARPSPCEGVGRLFDFANTLTQYNTSETGQEADYYAFTADWSAIADDMLQVMQEHHVEKIVAPKGSPTR